MKFILAFLALLTPCLAMAQGTYWANTCSYADVNDCINGSGVGTCHPGSPTGSQATHTAVTGDTINIPAGSCTWGNNNSSDVGLSITNVGITLIGPGASGLTITDNEYKGSAGCGGPFIPLMDLNDSSNDFMRVSGFTVTQESPAGNCSESYETILAEGNSRQIRIDDMTINMEGVTFLRPATSSFGVMDHNTFNIDGNHIQGEFPIEVHLESYNGVGNYGDSSWAQADTFGTASAWYIETNTFNWPSSGSYPFPTGCFDSEDGGRLVFRFNTGCPFVAVHGTESSGRHRSARSYEIYNNSFAAVQNTNGNMYTGVFLRGGTGRIFNNTFTDASGGTSPYEQLVIVVNYRSTNTYANWAPWGAGYGGGGCDGRSPYDTNLLLAVVTGTASGSASGDSFVDSDSPGWTTNEWQNYSLRNTTKVWGSAIDSSGSNTATTEAAAQGPAHAWSAGDAYEINKVYPCIDQIGRGAGLLIQDLVSGDEEPVLQSTGNPGSPAEASDPVYEWLNSHNGTTSTTAIHVDTPVHIQNNRDYYEYTTSFNGTSGTGSGTLASRPSTCTVGVGYWATDQGNWNQSDSGGQGQLFVCTTTNTWSLYYTPYTYPHPLTLGQTTTAGPPSAPTGLTAEID